MATAGTRYSLTNTAGGYEGAYWPAFLAAGEELEAEVRGLGFEGAAAELVRD